MTKTPKPTLQASAATLKDIIKLISQYYFGTKVTLIPVDGYKWEVHNSNGKIESVHVVLKKNRFRFEVTYE